MPGRKRTAKSLGTRHDLGYFKKWTPFRRWRMLLSVAVPALVLGWLAIQAVRGHHVVYSAGPLSAAHSVFGNQCALCHLPEVNGLRRAGFRKHVTDEACLSCHEAPAHHASQPFTPSCGSCHVEHTGERLIARVGDAQCVQCHGNLRANSGALHFVSHITGFNGNHPEFAPLREAGSDPGTIAFNHAAHLGHSIQGPHGNVKLDCSDCHRPFAEAAEPWKYGATSGTQPQERAGHAEVFHPDAGRELMMPITYANQCAACHTLQFDRRFAEEVPHREPAIVRAFVEEKFRLYLAQHPGAWREAQAGVRSVSRFVSRSVPGYTQPAQPRSPDEWVNLRVAESVRLLWGKTCKQCHQLEFSSGELPSVKPAAITPRWLPHADFSHEAHRELECLSCHGAAATSQQTSDVLLPGIKTCRECHNGEPTRAGRAENGCFECHRYHNWQGRKGFKGTYSLPQLLGKMEVHDVRSP